MSKKICNDCGGFFAKSDSPIRCQPCVERKRAGGGLITRDKSASVRSFYGADGRLHYKGGWWKKRGRTLTKKEMKRRGLL